MVWVQFHLPRVLHFSARLIWLTSRVKCIYRLLNYRDSEFQWSFSSAWLTHLHGEPIMLLVRKVDR